MLLHLFLPTGTLIFETVPMIPMIDSFTKRTKIKKKIKKRSQNFLTCTRASYLKVRFFPYGWHDWCVIYDKFFTPWVPTLPKCGLSALSDSLRISSEQRWRFTFQNYQLSLHFLRRRIYRKRMLFKWESFLERCCMCRHEHLEK